MIFEVISDEVWPGPSSFSRGMLLVLSSCILCIFIGYRVRKILIMHGLNFNPGYIRGFNCSGEKRLPPIIQLLSQRAQTMAVSKPFICRANSNLMTVLFYHKWPRIGHRVKSSSWLSIEVVFRKCKNT